jgi:small-conductance mechanosensitive channel
MKSLRNIFIFIGLIQQSSQAFGLGPITSLFNTKWEVGQTFSQLVEKNIEELKKRQEIAEKAYVNYKTLLEATQKMAATLKLTLGRVRATELEYISHYVGIVTKTSQILTEIIQVYQDIQILLQDHMKALDEYKQDPEFTKKGLPFEQKSIYSIEDFQRIMSVILRYDAELKSLIDRQEKLNADTLVLKKNLELARQALGEKKQEQKELKEQKPDSSFERQKFTLKQQGALLDAEERLLANSRDLIEARLREADTRGQVIEFQIKTTRLQLDMLQRQEDHVRQELRIDRKDIDLAQKKLQQQIQESGRLQEDYNRRVEGLNLLRQSELDQILLVKERSGITDETLEKMYEWSFRPVSSAEWRLFLEVGRLHNHIMFETEVLKEIFQARVEQEKANVIAQETATSIIQTWEGLTNGTFDGSTDLLNKEMKKYEKQLVDLESSLASLADKRVAASRLLSQNTSIAEAIQARFKEFMSQRETVFRGDQAQYSRLGEVLKNEGQIEAQKRSELITQLIELYTSLAQQRNLVTKKIEMMVRVLRTKVQDKLVPPLWSGIKKFIPDLGRFINYLGTPARFHGSIEDTRSSLSLWIRELASHPLSLLIFFLYLLITIVSYGALHLYLKDFGIFIMQKIKPEYGFIAFIAGLFGVVLQFLADHLFGIFSWSILLLIVRYAASTYVATLFHICSIPFWLYYVHRFIRYAKSINIVRDYPFASKNYQERFFSVVAVFLSCTIVLVLFKEALMRVLPHSDAPRILQALNFVIFQVSMMFMMSREQILLLIPRHTALGKWIQELVNDYYYLFLGSLVFIIVMSNPYLGFGTSFLYLIGRILLIMIMIPLMIILHNAIKSFLSSFFFYSDEEGRLNDRFPYARTSYGLFIIGSFVFFSVVALVLAANVWGFKVGYQEILSWLRKEWYSYQSAETGVKVAVNLIHILRVFFYVIVGVVIAFLINKFVLRRMFDLLLVNAGLQSIFLSLTRYIIVFVAIVIGLQSIGLGTSMFVFLGALAGLGIIGKEVIADFIGYFLILVQRPLKIGDFVRIENDEKGDLEGVVRHLSLRSVILRKKNSVTVIIPNSYVLSRPLTNWNYYRMYFAFDDISITVPYSADPDRIRALFLKVLDDNYEILRNPAPIVRLQAFAENGYHFIVRGYLSHDKVYEQADIASEIRLELVRTLRKNGYEIAVPSRLVRIVKDGKSEILETILDEIPKE